MGKAVDTASSKKGKKGKKNKEQNPTEETSLSEEEKKKLEELERRKAARRVRFAEGGQPGNKNLPIGNENSDKNDHTLSQTNTELETENDGVANMVEENKEMKDNVNENVSSSINEDLSSYRQVDPSSVIYQTQEVGLSLVEAGIPESTMIEEEEPQQELGGEVLEAGDFQTEEEDSRLVTDVDNQGENESGLDVNETTEEANNVVDIQEDTEEV